MYRKTLFVLLSIGIIFALAFCGCKKKSPEPAGSKTEAQYKADAEKEITEENMETQLDKLEKDLEADVNAEQ